MAPRDNAGLIGKAKPRTLSVADTRMNCVPACSREETTRPGRVWSFSVESTASVHSHCERSMGSASNDGPKPKRPSAATAIAVNAATRGPRPHVLSRFLSAACDPQHFNRTNGEGGNPAGLMGCGGLLPVALWCGSQTRALPAAAQLQAGAGAAPHTRSSWNLFGTFWRYQVPVKDEAMKEKTIITSGWLGEPAGTRTQDPLIKSQVLYRLSYGLVRACDRGRLPQGQ
jgi:hypothetical protein